MKRIVFVLLIASILFVVGCGEESARKTNTAEDGITSKTETTPTQDTEASKSETTPTQDKEVNLSVTGLMEGNTLYIEGTATVPDGALISYEVSASNADTLSMEAPLESWFLEGTTPVSNEAWKVNLDVSQFVSGPIEIWASFTFFMVGGAKQPQEVISIYGELGGKMTGLQVVDQGLVDGIPMKRAEITATIIKP